MPHKTYRSTTKDLTKHLSTVKYNPSWQISFPNNMKTSMIWWRKEIVARIATNWRDVAVSQHDVMCCHWNFKKCVKYGQNVSQHLTYFISIGQNFHTLVNQRILEVLTDTLINKLSLGVSNIYGRFCALVTTRGFTWLQNTAALRKWSHCIRYCIYSRSEHGLTAF